MTDGRPQVLVAPREIHDLVFRCARVAGLDAGAADRSGRNVTAAEVHLGGAVETFASVLGDPQRLAAEFGAGPDVLVEAEVEARATGSAVARFGVPTPLAALASVIADIGGRGLGVDGVKVGATAATTVDELEVTGPPPSSDGTAAARAARDGLAVDRVAFDALIAAARPFLVAESILDEIED
ncbi:MAG TPA: hypothetical protein DGK99_04615 [Acidimicrobiaceae bacterium]|nr:hypothetical protein [Acidimicrobiaceae bacterium]